MSHLTNFSRLLRLLQNLVITQHIEITQFHQSSSCYWCKYIMYKSVNAKIFKKSLLTSLIVTTKTSRLHVSFETCEPSCFSLHNLYLCVFNWSYLPQILLLPVDPHIQTGLAWKRNSLHREHENSLQKTKSYWNLHWPQIKNIV